MEETTHRGGAPSRYRNYSEKERRQREERRQEAEPVVGVAGLVRRFDRGLDLWTGRPLGGLDRQEWIEARREMWEEEGRRMAKAFDDLLRKDV